MWVWTDIMTVKGLQYNIEYQSVCPVVWIGSPHPLPLASVASPIWALRGSHTHLQGRGLGDLIQTTG